MKRSSPFSDCLDATGKRTRLMMKLEAHTPVLERFWNNTIVNSTGRLVKHFLAVGPTSTRIKRMPFDEAVSYLREENVIAATKACLLRFHLLTNFRHGSPASTVLVPERVNVRVFLAGFMIAYHPTIFERMGALEQALFDSTVPLIEAFESICHQMAADPSFAHVPHELTKNFPTLLLNFFRAFKAWKVHDEARVTKLIKHTLVALYRKLEHLSPDEPEDSKMKMKYNSIISRLRAKLQKMAGTDALKAFEEEYAKHGQIQTVDGEKTGSAYVSLPGRNEQLVHELLLDPLFQLDETGGCSTENLAFHGTLKSFHCAFWDSIEDDVKLEPPCYVRVIRVLEEICNGIHNLLSDSGIHEVIDLAFVK